MEKEKEHINWKNEEVDIREDMNILSGFRYKNWKVPRGRRNDSPKEQERKRKFCIIMMMGRML